MPIVDAHPHIYSPDRDTYPTIEDPWEPGEPASAEDLKKKMDAIGIDRAIFIQTSTFYGHDNRYIMDSAKEHADWACGVVTLDPDDQSHVDLLEEAVANSNIRGMRGTTDSINRIATPNVYRLWTKAMELGIPVNCMVMDDLERVPEIERIAQDLGDLKIVIDHCFMLNTRQKTEETLVALERLAKLPNVYAKLTSGTHGSYRVYPYPDMHDPLKRVIEAFGPSRCVWGSNFPNTLWSKGATYAQNLHLFVKELSLSLPDKADILGVTAMSLWFPNEHEQEERAISEQRQRTERESIRAQQADEDAVDEVEEPEEAKSHKAQITQMADLIAAQGVIEGPIVDEVDEIDLKAILDAAGELNAVLDTLDFPANPAQVPDETDDSPEPLLEFTHEDEEVDDVEPTSPADVTVNVEELMASQSYTPIKTDEIGTDETVDADVASDVQAQLDAALGSVAEAAKFEPEEVESEDQITVNVEELLAAHGPASGEDSDDDEVADEVGQPDDEDDGEFDMSSILAAADELNAALESQSEASKSTEPEPVSEVAEDIVVNVDELLASQDAGATEAADVPGPAVDTPVDEDEFDLDTMTDVANQLATMLESVEGIASNINDLAADAEKDVDDQRERPSA